MARRSIFSATSYRGPKDENTSVKSEFGEETLVGNSYSKGSRKVRQRERLIIRKML